MKKSVFIFLVGVTLLSFNTMAEITGGTCSDDGCQWSYNSDTKELIITGSGASVMDNYTPYSKENPVPWAAYHEEIESVSVSGLKSTGDRAFLFHTALTDVSLSEGLQTLNFGAFYGASSLENVNLPASLTQIGDRAFHQMSSLESITIPKNVTSIGSECFASSVLSNITFENDSNLRTIGGLAFQNDTNLGSIVLPDKLETIEWRAFKDSGLTNIVLPDSLSSIGQQAFSGATNLQNIVIPEGVSVGPWAFEKTTAKVYYPESTEFSTYGIGTSNLQLYQKDKAGVYVLKDSNGNVIEDENNNPIYYISADDMTSSNACTDGYESCARQALEKKALALTAKNWICKTLEACQALVYADYNGNTLKANGKDYASLNDLLKGNAMPKRIYTIDEANAVAKPTGNTVRIRYK